jgi:hypothetical protein
MTGTASELLADCERTERSDDYGLIIADMGLRILDLEERVALYRSELLRALTYRMWDDRSGENN